MAIMAMMATKRRDAGMRMALGNGGFLNFCSLIYERP